MAAEEIFHRLLGLGDAWKVVSTEFEEKNNTFVIAVEETPKLWPQPMVKVAEMIEAHLEGILGHWKAGLTTAFLEGLNSLFSATKRKARGFRSTRYLITMLYFVAGKLRIPCL